MSEEATKPVAPEESANRDAVKENNVQRLEDNVSTAKNEDKAVVPQNVANGSCGCGHKESPPMDMVPSGFIYAIGRIEPRFPSLGVEKEYQQVVGRTETRGQTNFGAMHKALSQTENRYLTRQMCWVLKVEGIETYLLIPRDPQGYDTLIDTIRVPPRATDVDVVIGRRGPIATPDMCNGLMLPIVIFDQVYSFDTDSLMKSIPKRGKADSKFTESAEELFNRISQLADNVGSTDEHRALNYLSVRYDAIYAKAAEMQDEEDSSLSMVDVRRSRLSGTRNIVDVIFVYRNRKTDASQMEFVRVDVTDEFPFLVSKLAPYYER